MKDTTTEALLDTGRANEYMLAYLDLALYVTRTDKKAAEDIRQALLRLLDMFTAREALEQAKTLE